MPYSRSSIAPVRKNSGCGQTFTGARLSGHDRYFKDIINAIPQIVWSTLADGYHDYYNQQWYDFTGMPEGSTDGEGWNGMFHPDDQSQAWKLWNESLGTGEPYEIHYRLRHHTGEYRWVLGRALPMRDGHGNIIRWMGTCTDVHEQKMAESKRQRNAERMSLAIESAGAGIFEYNHRSEEFTWDSRMRELFGVDQDFIPSLEAIVNLQHPEDRDPVGNIIAQLAHSGGSIVKSEVRVRQRDNSTRWIQTFVRNSQGLDDDPKVIIGMAMDVTQSREQEQQLAYQATHDALTGLMNRFEFTRRLIEAQQVSRCDQKDHVVCFIDLDHFKFINDNYGHAAGDVVLKDVAKAMKQQIRTSDALARIGGDEFGVLLTCCSIDRALIVAESLIDTLESFSFNLGTGEHLLGASIGIAALKGDCFCIDEVMSQADIACYTAKHSGRNRVSVYQPETGEAVLHHRLIRTASSIRGAIEKNRFCLFAQPIVSTTGAIGEEAYYELLLRMLNEEGGLIAPKDFIPAAERYGLMPLVDRWVLTEIFDHKATEIAAIPGMSVAINISGCSLNDTKFLPFVEALIDQSLLPPERVHFEITETSSIEFLELASITITKLSQLGCSVALDDFGSGLSSYKYIREFPLDYLKIDGSFIVHMKDSVADQTIVRSIHDIAQGLGLKTVAEYVENEETLALVKEIGIDYVQGYGIGRPEALEVVLSKLLPKI